MADAPSYRPVYKALLRPLTVCGVDRRLFFLALLLGASTFNLFYSFLAGLLMFVGLYGFALFATRRDPDHAAHPPDIIERSPAVRSGEARARSSGDRAMVRIGGSFAITRTLEV